MEKLSIELTVNEWNVIMQALGKQPFEVVNSVILAIRAQADAKMGEQKPADA